MESCSGWLGKTSFLQPICFKFTVMLIGPCDINLTTQKAIIIYLSIAQLYTSAFCNWFSSEFYLKLPGNSIKHHSPFPSQAKGLLLVPKSDETMCKKIEFCWPDISALHTLNMWSSKFLWEDMAIKLEKWELRTQAERRMK